MDPSIHRLEQLSLLLQHHAELMLEVFCFNNVIVLSWVLYY